MTETHEPAAERIATTLLEDEPARAHLMLTNLITTAAYLIAKAEWSMEDNFTTTEAICSEVETSRAASFIASTEAATALSTPRRMAMGLAPAARFFKPSRIMA